MNANELIKKLERAKGIVYNEMGCDELIVLAIEESQKIISRSRIRETATEPPTREDGGSGDHGQYVMARAKGNYWEEIQLIYVAENPDEYPHWTCVPQLPEVTS